MAAMGGFLLAVAACVVIAAVLIPWLLRQRGAEDLATVAARHGLAATAISTPSGAPAWPSRCSARATGGWPRTSCGASGPTAWPPGRSTSRTTSRPRDNLGHVQRHHTHFSCAMAQVDGAWPEVSITREGLLEKALDLVGLGDIELESDEFNRQLRAALARPALRRHARRRPDDRLPPDHRGPVRLLREGPLGAAGQRPGRAGARAGAAAPGRGVRRAHPARRLRAVAQPVPRRATATRWRPATRATAPPLAQAELDEGNPWDGAARRPVRRARGDDDGPEYDLDGNVVEELPEDPWGSTRAAAGVTRT